MEPLRVLSIDFDYFQKVDLNTLRTCYPDGIDRPTPEANKEWKKIYRDATKKKLLEKVTTDQKALQKVKTIVQNNFFEREAYMKPRKAFGMIEQSHVKAYDFIQTYYAPEVHSGIELYNIDMHPDMINKNSKIDCGNWIKHLILNNRTKTRNVTLKWIYNPVSAIAYKFNHEFDDFATENLSVLDNKFFNLIFLCRSDNWVPPHLDNDFIELAKTIQKTTKCNSFKDAMHSRWDRLIFRSYRKGE